MVGIGGAALLGVVRGWEASGQDGLEEFLSALPAGSAAGGRVIEAFTRGKVARGTPEAAMAWAESLPGRDDDNPLSSFKVDVIGRVAEVLVESEPEKAAAWVARVRGDSARVLLLMRVGMRWAKKDGAAAMRWLSTLPSNRDLPTAIQETYRSWYLKDPKAAGDWIRAATLEPWLDPAVATYALQRSPDDINESIEWANRVVDPHRREATLEKIAMVWISTAPDDARAWMARAPIQDETRQRVEAYAAQRAKFPGAPPPLPRAPTPAAEPDEGPLE